MSSFGDQWAHFQVDIVDKSGNLIKNVLDLEWDIRIFWEWLMENENAILNDNFPFPETSPSIAKFIDDFYNVYSNLKEYERDRIDVKNSKALIADYSRRHWIVFALGGVENGSEAYIGKFNNGMTISLCNETDQWAYNVEVSNFFRKAKIAYDQFIDETK